MSIDVGPTTQFGMGTFIHPTARVGRNTQLGQRVFIGQGVVIGEDCRIQHGAVIGAVGFGYERDEDGRWAPKAHDYGVVIDDDVHIGANTCVDRGSHRATHILRGARIDNLVHIAHNVIVGEDSVVVAHAMLAGSVIVGNGAWIGPSASVLQRLVIGHQALVGMGAVVIDHVAPNTTVVGNPARVIDPEVGVRERM